MKSINKITYGLIGGTFGVTAIGAMDGVAGEPSMAIGSVVLCGAAMIAALITRQKIERKKLNEVDMKLG
jgi:hypothetical protein